MSTRTADQALRLVRPYPTLAQLRTEILADEALPLRRRQDIASACRSLAQALGQPLDAILAEPRQLRTTLQGLTPAMAGLAPGRWRNILSLLRHALGHLGLISVPGRYQVQPSPAWAALLPQLPAYGDRYVLARFARYCTQSGLEPAQVDDAVLATYLQDLEAQSLDQDPQRMHRDTAVKWNRAAERLPDWPQQRLTVADNRNTYALPWERFPASLRADVDAWLHRLGGQDFQAGRNFKPLRPASIASRKRQLHEYLSALVLQGEDPASMPNLASVVTPARAYQGLLFFWERAGNQPSVHAGQVAGVVLAIARHRAKLPEAEIAEIQAMGRNVALHHTSMTPRNRARLRAAAEPARRDALLTLPEQLRAEVVREKTPAPHLAQRLQTAVAIELLTMAPIRLKNLAELQVGRTLLCDRKGSVTICLPADEVKNQQVQDIVLPAVSARLITLYLRTYRPLLGAGGTGWLFPGRTPAGHKSHDGLRSQIAKAIAERCGLVFNPHLFRHFSATLILQDNPGAHGQVQRILGHKTLKTAMTYYTGLEAEAAFQHFDQHVLRLREQAAGLPARPRRGRKGVR